MAAPGQRFHTAARSWAVLACCCCARAIGAAPLFAQRTPVGVQYAVRSLPCSPTASELPVPCAPPFWVPSPAPAARPLGPWAVARRRAHPGLESAWPSHVRPASAARCRPGSAPSPPSTSRRALPSAPDGPRSTAGDASPWGGAFSGALPSRRAAAGCSCGLARAARAHAEAVVAAAGTQILCDVDQVRSGHAFPRLVAGADARCAAARAGRPSRTRRWARLARAR